MVATVVTAPVHAVAAPPKPPPSYVIAVSDSYLGSAWRNQMESEVQAEAMTPQDQPFVKRLIVENAGNNVPGQARQLKSLIGQHVQAILVDAASSTGLNAAIREVHKHHIRVVSFDNLVTSPYATKVDYSDAEWGARGATYLVKQLRGTGRVILLTGGTRASSLKRQQGAMQVFGRYHDIKVVARVNGGGNAAGGRQAARSLLKHGTKFDAVWSSGGMATGFLPVIMRTNRSLVAVTDATSLGFLRLLERYRGRGLKGLAVGDAPWIGAFALNVALAELQGKHLRVHFTVPTRTYSAGGQLVNARAFSDSFNVDFTSPMLGTRGQLTAHDALNGACCYK